MGTWAVPNTVEKIRILEEAMKQPLPASEFEAKYWNVIGDDGLMDMVVIAARKDPAADVRTAVAATLEAWARWYPLDHPWLEPWEAGVLERARFLAESYLDGDLADLVSAHTYNGGLANTPEAAAIKVADLINQRNGEEVHYKVARITSGIYAVQVPEADLMFRVETINGVAMVCEDADQMERLKHGLFEAEAPALRH